MKKLYTFLGIILVCFGILSGCKTLFDVVPVKGIYSPIELNSATTKVSSTSSVNCFCSTPTSYTTNVEFIIKDPKLAYRIVVFYDSVAASTYIQKNIKSNTYEIKEAKALGLPENKRTASIAINPDLGQFQYIVPEGYDSLKTFVSQDYIKVKISPWEKLPSMPSQAINGFVNLVQGTDKLSFISTDDSKISGYGYDSLTRTWNLIGSFPKSYSISGATSTIPNFIPKKITSVYQWIFYQDNKYYMVISQYTDTGNNGIYNYGIATTDDKFTSFSVVSSFNFQQNNFYGSPILSVTYKKDTIRVFHYGVADGSADINGKLWLATHVIPGSKITRSSSYLPSNTSNTFAGPALSIGNKFVIGYANNQANFARFNINKDEIGIPTSITTSGLARVNTISLSDGLQGYVIGEIQVIYNVELTTNGTVSFKNIFYQNWFPGNGFSSIKQSILHKGKIILLLKNNELWLFNPNELIIDFKRNPPTIVRPKLPASS